jgi:hypothetical protein
LASQVAQQAKRSLGMMQQATDAARSLMETMGKDIGATAGNAVSTLKGLISEVSSGGGKETVSEATAALSKLLMQDKEVSELLADGRARIEEMRSSETGEKTSALLNKASDDLAALMEKGAETVSSFDDQLNSMREFASTDPRVAKVLAAVQERQARIIETWRKTQDALTDTKTAKTVMEGKDRLKGQLQEVKLDEDMAEGLGRIQDQASNIAKKVFSDENGALREKGQRLFELAQKRFQSASGGNMEAGDVQSWLDKVSELY